MLEKLFHLKENGTTVKTELIAGVTTFITMVYILALNPSILSASGMDAGSILTATAVASAIACFCMAAFSNTPFALSAGLGLNAYFAYTVCGVMGYPWQVALTAVLVEGIICQLVGIYVPNPELGYYSLIPTAFFSMPNSIAPTFFQFDFAFVASHLANFIVVVFAFLFVDIFDTLGTVIGCASKANMLDKDGKLPKIKGVLLADAVGTTVGAILGTSTITTFVESSSGITEGGRTGLTSVTTGILFLAALFLSPLFLTIPSFATAPALIVVGFLMMQQVVNIEWNDITKAFPCFVCITMMGFAYSISEGIAFGFISYTFIHVITGKAKEISLLMYILTGLFILKFFII